MGAGTAAPKAGALAGHATHRGAYLQLYARYVAAACVLVQINVVMDYANGGSLFEYVQARTKLPEALARWGHAQALYSSRTVSAEAGCQHYGMLSELRQAVSTEARCACSRRYLAATTCA
jgi:hypothetical protein